MAYYCVRRSGRECDGCGCCNVFNTLGDGGYDPDEDSAPDTFCTDCGRTIRAHDSCYDVGGSVYCPDCFRLGFGFNGKDPTGRPDSCCECGEEFDPDEDWFEVGENAYCDFCADKLFEIDWEGERY